METRFMRTAETSKYVRKALKKAFPGVKFYVRSTSSVNVYWQDGPTTAQVDKVLLPYKGKDQDPYSGALVYPKSWLLPDGSAQRAGTGDDLAPQPEGAELVCFSDYLFTERAYSKAFIERVAADYSKECGWPAPEITSFGWWVGGKKRGEAFSFKVNLERQNVDRWFQDALKDTSALGDDQPGPKADSEPDLTCKDCCYYNSPCPGQPGGVACDDLDNPNAPWALEPELAPEPEPDFGPRPDDRYQTVHWIGQHVAHLFGPEWEYSGKPEYPGCKIVKVGETGDPDLDKLHKLHGICQAALSLLGTDPAFDRATGALKSVRTRILHYIERQD